MAEAQYKRQNPGPSRSFSQAAEKAGPIIRMIILRMIRADRKSVMDAVIKAFSDGKEGGNQIRETTDCLIAETAYILLVSAPMQVWAIVMKRTFFVKAVWDDEAKVFYSQSDIDGLHIEAPTVDAFEDVLFDAAIDLIVANHMSAADLADTPIRDLIPAILWERPNVIPAAA